ncbi:MAG: hypothetical protein K1X36_09840 [Pyrinomonadaceae bacterium]|nr:hypothetical protein [Pyrinomonadaceae bacterium]
MLISILLICAISFGGLALTYLFVSDERFMWRLAAGSIVGTSIFGIVCFVLASLLGLNAATSAAAVAVAMLPLIILTRTPFKREFKHDWAKAKGKFQGGNLKRFTGFGYYAFFAIVFWLFFGQAMYQTDAGIFTGGSNNLGDLPFHLGAILGFTDGANFPPQNPSFAGARFSYPFIADLVTAGFMKLGADVRGAMVIQDFAWAFSLLVILERFTIKLTGNKLAGRIAPFLLFFSGGLGFVWFAKDYWEQGKGLWEFIWHLPRDYTIGEKFRWGNSLVVLFITQRSLLLGMPITLLVLGHIWRVFAPADGDAIENKGADAPAITALVKPFIIGLFAGMLPLIHLHSLAVLFVVTGFCFLFRTEKWRDWIAFGIGVSLIAVPELLWSMSGSASEAGKFIGWNFGWDKGDANVIWFWLKNTGIVIPMIAAGIYLVLTFAKAGDGEHSMKAEPMPDARSLLLFYIPFLLLYVVSNAVKLAPWEWDNIKVLIYWYVGSLPLIAVALAKIWESGTKFRALAVACVLAMTLSGGLDVWRTMSGQNKIRVFDTDAVRLAEQIKAKTPPNALFLNAPTYNSAVVLTGRRSFMRYIGHLSSHGIDYAEREEQTKRIYDGGGVAELYLRKNEIEYVLVSPEERNSLGANEEFFKKYSVIAESGQYRVYKIKN